MVKLLSVICTMQILGWVCTHADAAQPLTTAGEKLDDRDNYLDDDLDDDLDDYLDDYLSARGAKGSMCRKIGMSSRTRFYPLHPLVCRRVF